jgi:hypothetical protein
MEFTSKYRQIIVLAVAAAIIVAFSIVPFDRLTQAQPSL